MEEVTELKSEGQVRLSEGKQGIGCAKAWLTGEAKASMSAVGRAGESGPARGCGVGRAGAGPCRLG